MDVTIAAKSTVPVHRQLEEQIKQLIWQGQLVPGARLPSVRELAGYLRINRNTVAKAYEELEGEGFVNSLGAKGTFVVERPPTQPRTDELQLFLADTLRRAADFGLTAEDFSMQLLAYNQSAGVQSWKRRRVLLLECNTPQLEQFRHELEASLPVAVDTLLLDELAAAQPDYDQYAVVLTTFFHADEVKSRLHGANAELVTLLLNDNLPTLMRLKQLPKGTAVALICESEHGLSNFRRSLYEGGLDKLLVRGALMDDMAGVQVATEGVPIIICSSSVVEARVRNQLIGPTEIITDDRSLDKHGIELLRKRLNELDRQNAGWRGNSYFG